MAAGNRVSILLYIVLLTVCKGTLTRGGDLYVSRYIGNDNWSCNQSKPCKTIWRAVSLASRGDRVYLDGTKTDNDPYTCQSSTSRHPGIYVNTSLSLVGFGPMPQIRCAEGNTLMFDGSGGDWPMTVVFSRLLFHMTSVSIRDCYAEVNGCTFKGSPEGIDVTLTSRDSLSIRVNNSIFRGNSKCISVIVNSTRNAEQDIQVTFEVKNTSFEGNNIPGRCIYVTEVHRNQTVNCSVSLNNVSFSDNHFTQKGLVYVNLQNGNQNIYLQSVTFTNNHPYGTGFSECNILNTQNVYLLISFANFSIAELNARALSVSATNMSVQISNSNFSGYGIDAEGGVFYLSGKNFCSLEVINSSFLNTYSTLHGGAIFLECAQATVTFQQDVFRHNQAKGGAGGAVFVNLSTPLFLNSGKYPSDVSVSLLDTNFSSCSSSGAGGAVLVESTSKQSGRVSLHINNSRFEDCHSTGKSGGSINVGTVNAAEVSIDIRATTFSKCTSLGSGGAVYVNSTLSDDDDDDDDFDDDHERGRILLYIDNSTFEGCRSTGRSGGAVRVISMNQDQITARNCSFLFNSAFKHGGALSFMSHNSRVKIESSDFKNNSGVYGGAIHMSSSNASQSYQDEIMIRNSTFRNNWVSNAGGAIFFAKSIQSLILEHVTMESNSAHKGPGGAVCSDDSVFSVFIVIRQSLFLNNEAHQYGGVFSLPGVKETFEVFDSVFENNRVFKGMAGALHLPKFGQASHKASFELFNTTFTNCQAGSELGPDSAAGGAVYLITSGNSSLVIQRSRFTENASPIQKGGAIFVEMAPDKLKDPGCINGTSETGKFREWYYTNNLTITDTIFERNVAQIGGAVYLSHGLTSFQNCSFIDNFVTAQGGHIFTADGSASVVIHDSAFFQTQIDLQRTTKTFLQASFLHLESSGPFIMRNTTLNSTPYVDGDLLMIAQGSRVDFGDDKLTAFYCPVGSELQIQNFTNDVTASITCKIRLTVLDFSCLRCSGAMYSLQRGSAFGGNLAPGFQCLACPFGANCSRNIVAQPNFWGFKEQDSPPTLKFILCPLGYCSPPEPGDPLIYNGCQGNRCGVLCGHCKLNYTETLYSTDCRPSKQCNDFWFWPVVFLYVSLMALYLTFKPPILPWMQRQILWFNEPNPADNAPQFDRGYLKIIFYFYQTASLLLVSISPKSFITKYCVEPLLGLFNFQQKLSSNGLICPFPGLSVVTKHLASVFPVFGTLVMICLFCGVHCGVRKLRRHRDSFVGSYFSGMLETLLLGYSSLASFSLILLRCVPIGSDHRLFYDGSVVCLRGWQYIVIAITITFVVPFVFVLLWGSSKLYRRTISVERFLLACFLPLPFLCWWVFAKLINLSANDNSFFSHRLRDSVEEVLYDPYKRPEDGNRGALNWESVMIGRRLVLIFIFALVSDYFSRLLLMSFFCVLILLHHVTKQPFRDPRANVAETISLLSLTVLAMVNVFFASFISLAVASTGPFTVWQSVFQVVQLLILGFLPAVFGFLVVACILSQLCRFIFVTWNVLRFFCRPYCRLLCNFRQEDTSPLTPVT